MDHGAGPGATSERVAVAQRPFSDSARTVCVHRPPLVPAQLVSRAVAGMDAVRAGVYETGLPPQESAWQPGDDPRRLCKIEMSHVANRAIRDLVGHRRIGELAAELTGATMVQVWWTQLLYKPVVQAAGPHRRRRREQRRMASGLAVLGHLGAGERTPHRVGGTQRRHPSFRSDAVRAWVAYPGACSIRRLLSPRQRGKSGGGSRPGGTAARNRRSRR